jgi:hypothetical protein
MSALRRVVEVQQLGVVRPAQLISAAATPRRRLAFDQIGISSQGIR